jgi:MFS family permease
VLAVLLLFTLGNSTDAYLLLRLTDAGVPAAGVPLAWAALHIVKSATSVLGGWAGDRFGRRVTLCGGWALYAGVYCAFAVVSSPAALLAWFIAYGFYFGLTEGTEKALLTDLAPGALRGTVFGLHGAATGVGLLTASLVCGSLWQWRGPGAAFGLGASLALLACVLIWPAAGDRRHGA